MPFDEYFSAIFCINLKSRTDRWEECTLEFAQQKIEKVIRVDGVQGIPPELKKYGGMGVYSSRQVTETEEFSRKRLEGRIGCLMSHLKVIKKAKSEKLNRILILEDDVQFVSNVQSRFDSIIPRIPEKWQLLYLGGNEKGVQQRVNESIVRVSNMLMAHAIGIDASVYDELIERLSKCRVPVDTYYAELQKEHACFAVDPYLAWQRASWSDGDQRFRIYDFENRMPFLEEMLKTKTQ